MRILMLLILAAALEVGGDALIRTGLGNKSEETLLRGVFPMVAGAIVLIVYGFMVNLTGLDFGKLMGQYIVIFFIVAQLTAIVFFKETPKLPVLVGGALVIAGGAVMALWHA